MGRLNAALSALQKRGLFDVDKRLNESDERPGTADTSPQTGRGTAPKGRAPGQPAPSDGLGMPSESEPSHDLESETHIANQNDLGTPQGYDVLVVDALVEMAEQLDADTDSEIDVERFELPTLFDAENEPGPSNEDDKSDSDQDTTRDCLPSNRSLVVHVPSQPDVEIEGAIEADVVENNQPTSLEMESILGQVESPDEAIDVATTPEVTVYVEFHSEAPPTLPERAAPETFLEESPLPQVESVDQTVDVQREAPQEVAKSTEALQPVDREILERATRSVIESLANEPSDFDEQEAQPTLQQSLEDEPLTQVELEVEESPTSVQQAMDIGGLDNADLDDASQVIVAFSEDQEDAFAPSGSAALSPPTEDNVNQQDDPDTESLGDWGESRDALQQTTSPPDVESDQEEDETDDVANVDTLSFETPDAWLEADVASGEDVLNQTPRTSDSLGANDAEAASDHDTSLPSHPVSAEPESATEFIEEVIAESTQVEAEQPNEEVLTEFPEETTPDARTEFLLEEQPDDSATQLVDEHAVHAGHQVQGEAEEPADESMANEINTHFSPPREETSVDTTDLDESTEDESRRLWDDFIGDELEETSEQPTTTSASEGFDEAQSHDPDTPQASTETSYRPVLGTWAQLSSEEHEAEAQTDDPTESVEEADDVAQHDEPTSDPFVAAPEDSAHDSLEREHEAAEHESTQDDPEESTTVGAPDGESSHESASPALELVPPSAYEVEMAERLLHSDFGVRIQQLSERVTSQLPNNGSQAIALIGLQQDEVRAEAVAALGMYVCAQHAGPTLVVDADADARTISRGFGQVGNGLQDVLAGTSKWTDAVRPTSCEKLHLLPWTSDNQTADITDDQSMENLMERWLLHYDLVIVDAGTVDSAHARTVARACQAAFLCVPLGISDSQQLLKATQDLFQSGVNLRGCVTTGVSAVESH